MLSSRLAHLPRRRLLSAFAWGNADHGQLGLPSSLLLPELDTYGHSTRTPTPIPSLLTSSLLSVSASASHAAFLLSDGTLLTAGLSTSGQLGRPSAPSHPSPVPALPPVISAACGAAHTLALASDGAVYSFGDNAHGQLGRSGDPAKPDVVPALLRAGHRIVRVAAGQDFSVAVCEHGAIYSWGAAANGRLGHPTVKQRGALAFLLGKDPPDEPMPRRVRALDGVRIAHVFAGMHHVVALDVDGRAWAWGCGRHFQLGTGVEDDIAEPTEAFRELGKVAKVAAGGAHSLVLGEGGRVWAVGQNEHGCLGLGYEREAVVQAVSEPVLVEDVRGAADVAAGWHVSAAVVNGEVAMWGCGAAGALGNGEVVDHWAPVRIGVRARRVAIGAAGNSVFACD